MSRKKDTLSSTQDVFPQRLIIGPLTQATNDAFVVETVPTGIAQLQNIGENDTTVEVFELISVECVAIQWFPSTEVEPINSWDFWAVQPGAFFTHGPFNVVAQVRCAGA